MKQILTTLLVLSSIFSFSQEKQRSWELHGYISDMQSVIFTHPDSTWLIDNQIHNRINFNWYISKNISTSIQLRNRLIWGDQVRSNPFYAYEINHDKGFLDLSENLIKSGSFILNGMIDRGWIAYEKGKLNIKVGRQRINWGQTLAWNPNDLFNSYSFFDFDYIEKPGSDAIRLQYYTGMTSVVEVAAKVDEFGNGTFAGLYRFNKWNYDIQLIGGYLNNEDFVGGIGWSGAIKNAGFRGEMSYFHPRENFKDSTGLFFASISADYTFSNSLFLQAEFFYGQIPEAGKVNNFTDYYTAPLSVKNLAFTEYNIMAGLSYPATPLLNISLSGMYFPDMKGYFIGPSITYSLSDNVELSVIAQSFSGEFGNSLNTKPDRQTYNFGFIRFKWSY